MCDRRPSDNWYSPLARTIAESAGRGAFIAGFPEYRPDLVSQLAHALSFQMCDFREQVMLRAGPEAARLPLQRLDDFADEHALGGGLILQNAEALLSTKPKAERAAWLLRFLDRPWPTAIVLPMVLFSTDVNPDHSNFVRFESRDLPEQSLLMRLHSTR
ncbi:MAG: hypothetical protein GY798_31115 [Hyphomicrobiales bacterium]|nr:hypothetical protein [Hyphomicrobiales bacterium]